MLCALFNNTVYSKLTQQHVKRFHFKENNSCHAITVSSMLLVYLYLFYLEDKQIENEDAKGTV